MASIERNSRIRAGQVGSSELLGSTAAQGIGFWGGGATPYWSDTRESGHGPLLEQYSPKQ